ncbi:hypothetical protein N7486_000614 [Penicillium sp. IBT 16267x]|nr:hypothetical protein N7486_000614 [Penicillium sp. IBT 16267x]
MVFGPSSIQIINQKRKGYVEKTFANDPSFKTWVMEKIQSKKEGDESKTGKELVPTKQSSSEPPTNAVVGRLAFSVYYSPNPDQTALPLPLSQGVESDEAVPINIPIIILEDEAQQAVYREIRPATVPTIEPPGIPDAIQSEIRTEAQLVVQKTPEPTEFNKQRQLITPQTDHRHPSTTGLPGAFTSDDRHAPGYRLLSATKLASCGGVSNMKNDCIS